MNVSQHAYHFLKELGFPPVNAIDTARAVSRSPIDPSPPLHPPMSTVDEESATEIDVADVPAHASVDVVDVGRQSLSPRSSLDAPRQPLLGWPKRSDGSTSSASVASASSRRFSTTSTPVTPVSE